MPKTVAMISLRERGLWAVMTVFFFPPSAFFASVSGGFAAVTGAWGDQPAVPIKIEGRSGRDKETLHDVCFSRPFYSVT